MIIAPERTFWAPSSSNSINLNRNILSDSSHFPSTCTQGMHRDQRFRPFFFYRVGHTAHITQASSCKCTITHPIWKCAYAQTAYRLSSVGHEKYTCIKQLPISPHFPTHHQNKYTKDGRKKKKRTNIYKYTKFVLHSEGMQRHIKIKRTISWLTFKIINWKITVLLDRSLYISLQSKAWLKMIAGQQRQHNMWNTTEFIIM